MEEIWKDILGYEGIYQVSNLGRIRSVDRVVLYSSGKKVFMRGNNLKLRYNNSGYLYVVLSKNQTKSFFLVHRLVANAFISNISNKSEIDHINAVRDDNRVCNLRWVTKIENRNNIHTKIANKEANKLANRSVGLLEKKVVQMDLEETTIRVFNSLHSIEKELGYKS